MILKVIHAGVGFGSGTETSIELRFLNLEFKMHSLYISYNQKLCGDFNLASWQTFYLIAKINSAKHASLCAQA